MLAAAKTLEATDTLGVRAEMQQLQRDAIAAAMPGLLIAAAFFVIVQEASADRVLGLLACNATVVLALLVLALHTRSYRAAAWALIAGVTGVVLLLALWGGWSSALVLLAAPVGLAALLVSPAAGLVIAALFSAGLLAASQVLPAVAPELSLLAIAQMWLAAGLTTLANRPLLTITHWASASYQQNLALLDQARDQQVQLKQTLADLAAANQQLARLTDFARAMQRTAEEARTAKERFVANVSHELRTPLNMIIGFTEIIVQSPQSYGAGLPPTLLADLQVILRNSRHLSSLVDDVLDLSQIETGRMALTKERCSVADIVEAATTAVSRYFASKQLFLYTKIEPDLPAVFCDRTRVREVLLNVLSNAARFTEAGGVTVSVQRDGNDVLFSVTDTGPGIAADQINKLFQPFEQLDGSIRRRFGGSGLGLSISKGFVELHGGAMWIESTPGQGATVLFRLPIDAPAPLAVGASSWLQPEWEYHERARPSLAPPPTVRPRLALVESGNALSRMLGRYFDGVELVAHATLSAAIADSTETPVQAIVMNATSVPAALTEVVANAHLPVAVPVIISSLPETEDAAHDLGASRYLIKPLNPDQVVAILRSLNLTRRTILAVDDEPEALTLLMRLLSRSGAGYRVLTATNGHEALQIMRRRRVGAVLLDLVMPEMDGFRVLEECRSDTKLRAIPIVIMSARDPIGQPIVASSIAVAKKDGLSARQFLTCVDALRTILGPALPPPDQASPAGLPG